MGHRPLLEQELNTLRDDLLRMSSLLDRALDRTMIAFSTYDLNLARSVIEDGQQMDALHFRIQQHVERTVALQQPAARDLRRLIANLLIAAEIERMGDHAEGISATVLRTHQAVNNPPPAHLGQMREIARIMLRDSMDAYVDLSVEKARRTAARDHDIDRLYRLLFEQMIKEMSAGTIPVERGIYLLWAGHNIERIGDRITNICERVIYVCTGDSDRIDLNPSGPVDSSTEG